MGWVSWDLGFEFKKQKNNAAVLAVVLRYGMRMGLVGRYSYYGPDEPKGGLALQPALAQAFKIDPKGTRSL